MLRHVLPLLFVSAAVCLPAKAGQFPLPDQKFDVSIRDQDVRTVLNELSVAIELPILMSEAVQGRVNASFNGADARSLLDGIAEDRRLDWRFDGQRIQVTAQSEQVTRIVDLDGVTLKNLTSALETLDVYNERFRVRAVDGEFAMIVAPPDYIAVVEVILGALIESEAEKRKEREIAEKDRRDLARRAELQRLELQRIEQQRLLELERARLLRAQRGPQIIRNGQWGG